MEIEFKPLEPCFVGGLKVRVLTSDDIGYGFSSPCPQLYLTVQGKEVAVIGYGNIAIIRGMLDHALSNGPYQKSNTEFTEEELREQLETIHGKDKPWAKDKIEAILKKKEMTSA